LFESAAALLWRDKMARGSYAVQHDEVVEAARIREELMRLVEEVE